MDLNEALRKTVKALEDADVPEDLRNTAFEKAFDWLTQGSDDDRDAGSVDLLEPKRSSGGLLRDLARKLGLDPALVEDVFYVDDGEIGIGVAASSLERSKSGGTRQLALLVAAARQGSGLEDWTASAAIRAVCTDYGRFDSANFANTLRSMGPVFSYRGKGHNLEVRLTRPGIERAAALVQRLAGSE